MTIRHRHGRARLRHAANVAPLLCLLGLFFLAASASRAAAFDIRDALSPRNAERPLRRYTRYIVLHTTEAPDKSSLNKVRERGEAHYVVSTAGVVYRVVDRKRVAYHAGRSMWDGKTDLDRYSIGIEVVGYHDRDLAPAQYRALHELLRQLRRLYRIPDQRVLTHSMVAYGAPNRWHRRPHRGRKRCGMQFATDSVRHKLGLRRKPAYDPDVRAGRLVEADPYLARVLYGREAESSAPRKSTRDDPAADPRVIVAGRSAWDIARERYNRADTVYVFPDGQRRRGDQIGDWRAVPSGTRVLTGAGEAPAATAEEGRLPVLGRDGATASEIAGEAYNRSTTFYRLPDGRVLSGARMTAAEFKKMPAGTLALIGYAAAGVVAEKRTAFDLCGPRWNHPSTYYRFPDGTLRRGREIREGAIPPGTLVFLRQ
jgi:N-acetylmuramoyl-L-alanine amidase